MLSTQFTPSCTQAAAIGGQLRVLQWLIAQGCECSAEVVEYAAGGGHIHVLKWLRAAGAELDGNACDAAAGGGHLDCLKWWRAGLLGGRAFMRSGRTRGCA